MRLFLAINFPEEIRRRAWDAAGALRHAAFPVRWVPVERMHLTVKFLGEVRPDRIGAVVDATREAVEGMRAFDLPLGGFGAFPNPRNPRVVWVGCEPEPPLEILQDRVERALHAVGYPLEGKPFRPHLTVGRARKQASRRDWDGFGAALDSLEYHDAARVTSVDLMESTLRSGGPEYRLRTAMSLEA